MSRPKGSIIGAKPTWTTTATSGIWSLRQAEEMQADGKWPRGPVAPTSLAGTAGNEQVALTWTAPATTHGTITDYVVEYTPAAGSPTLVATGSTAASYTLTGVTNDTEYTFRVAAVNHTRGDWSDSVAVTPNSGPSDPDFASVSLLLHADGADGSTTFTDSSSGGLTVTAYGDEFYGNAQISTAQSKFGGASIRLLGSSQYFTTSGLANIGSGDFCVEFWANSPWDTDTMLFDFRTNAQLALWTNNTSLYLFQNGTYAPRATVTPNSWQHIAVTRDSGVIRLYLDGVQQYSVNENVSLTTSSGTQWFGKPYDAFWSNPNLYIDELRISVGVSRYPSGTTFTPPTAPFPDQ